MKFRVALKLLIKINIKASGHTRVARQKERRKHETTYYDHH